MKIVQLSNNTSLAVQPIYTTTNQDENVIIIFLHEALGSIPQWKAFPQELCDALHLNGIVYERQGHGNSSPLSESRNEMYLHDYAYKELPTLLNTILSPDKKVILVGHSDGASIALLFAACNPKKVVGIISMAAHVIVEEVTLHGIAPAVKAFENKKLEGLRKYHGEKTDDLFYAWAKTWNHPSFRDWNICNELKTINCPVLAIQGENDQYGTETQLLLIQENIPHKTTLELIKNCGHHPHLEQATTVIDLIKEWHTLNFER